MSTKTEATIEDLYKLENPKVYHRGETAEAEPSVPSWTLPVDDLFVGEG